MNRFGLSIDGRTRSFWRPVGWRSMAFVLVFSAGLIGLMAGVGVSERDLSGLGLAEQAYYALGLFVLGGLDIGTPIGGPGYGRALLWVAYFGAPLITASALIEAAADSSVSRVCEIFNGHEFAAIHLVQEHFLRRFQSTPHRDLVVLIASSMPGSWF